MHGGASTNVTDRRKQLLDEKLRRYKSLMAILEYSNATPLRNRSDRGFHCAYCLENFLEPAELKRHVLKAHGDVKLKYGHLKKLLRWDSIKMDVTALQCSICRVQMKELADLREHINAAHGKDLRTENKDRIIPFKFDDLEGMRCAVCFQTFVSFNMLLRHMNVHYRNYVCGECQAGFVAERLLKYHVKESHAQGEFQCGSCEKIFSTVTKKRDHERAVHCGFKRNKCPYCPERFMSHIQRSSHIVKFHGKHSVSYKCNGCEKSFDSRKNLTQHVRAYHLMEKMHSCTQCDKSFFRKICLDNHMLRHTGEKRYVCDICSKSYGRKFTLREHMRIHINDRRFKCEECSQSFVQKCSWRSHMRTRHNITV
ncbi:Zinc finger protein 287 [Eumeta japonica]|uniref:Zinc finger protein 287 n=1 Tax=Eumeta variegata TaxID=151549 RepID=A0A4C1VXW6_EUMVA|nr:Zinc finger protein 287 [Eumeta japonica]